MADQDTFEKMLKESRVHADLLVADLREKAAERRERKQQVFQFIEELMESAKNLEVYFEVHFCGGAILVGLDELRYAYAEANCSWREVESMEMLMVDSCIWLDRMVESLENPGHEFAFKVLKVKDYDDSVRIKFLLP